MCAKLKETQEFQVWAQEGLNSLQGPKAILGCAQEGLDAVDGWPGGC